MQSMARKKVSSLMPTPAAIEEAAYAVFDRPGGEDLTRDAFREEVLGLLRHSGTATEKQIDALYKRIYGGASARKKSPAQLDAEIASALGKPKTSKTPEPPEPPSQLTRVKRVAAMMVDLLGDDDWNDVDFDKLASWLDLGPSWQPTTYSTRELAEQLLEQSLEAKHVAKD
jgi:hypothetical protein